MESGAQDHTEETGVDQPNDEAHTVVGDEGQDVPKDADSQQPLASEDAHGSVTPRSAPDPQHQTGETAPDVQQAGDAGEGKAQGE